MKRYYKSRPELADDDEISDWLRRLSVEEKECADINFMMREDVIPNGTRERYEAALQRLVDTGRVSTSTRP